MYILYLYKTDLLRHNVSTSTYNVLQTVKGPETGGLRSRGRGTEVVTVVFVEVYDGSQEIFRFGGTPS